MWPASKEEFWNGQICGLSSHWTEGLGVLAVPAWTEALTWFSPCPFLGDHDSWGDLQVPNLSLVLRGLTSFTLKSGQKTVSQCVLFPGLRCFGIWDQADLEGVPFSGQFPEIAADLPRWLCLPHTQADQSRLHPLPSIALSGSHTPGIICWPLQPSPRHPGTALFCLTCFFRRGTFSLLCRTLYQPWHFPRY